MDQPSRHSPSLGRVSEKLVPCFRKNRAVAVDSAHEEEVHARGPIDARWEPTGTLEFPADFLYTAADSHA